MLKKKKLFIFNSFRIHFVGFKIYQSNSLHNIRYLLIICSFIVSCSSLLWLINVSVKATSSYSYISSKNIYFLKIAIIFCHTGFTKPEIIEKKKLFPSSKNLDTTDSIFDNTLYFIAFPNRQWIRTTVNDVIRRN